MLINSADSINKILDYFGHSSEEFCFSLDFSPEFIDRLCFNGFLPMAAIAKPQTEILLIKLHHQRCILNFNKLHISKNISRYCKGLTFSINSDFNAVIDRINEHHGEECWLHSKLLDCLFQLHRQNTFATKTHVVEIWDGETLVAGELGYSVGSVYTSMSGFYTKNGAGTVQLAVLAKYLQAQGFSFWDLGMAMDYKLNLGGTLIKRNQFLDIIKQHRNEQAGTLCTNAKIDVKKLIFG